jgi:hypothetical protein
MQMLQQLLLQQGSRQSSWQNFSYKGMHPLEACWLLSGVSRCLQIDSNQ